MSATDWLVLIGGVVLVALVNWWFLLGGRTSDAPPANRHH